MPSPASSPGFCSSLGGGFAFSAGQAAVTFRRRKRVSSLFRGIWALWQICISQLRSLPRRSLHLQTQDEALHPQGGSGFELQIKRNFQPSDVGCRMRLHRFGDNFQGWTSQTPSLPPPPRRVPLSSTSSHPNPQFLVTLSAALPNSEPVLRSLTFLPVPEERGLQQH